jgi:conjugal transfer/type IV secretion protein DotA/TraY
LDNTTGLFTPREGPFGVGFLDQLSGGAASWMFYGNGDFDTPGSILGTVFSTLNLAVIIFAVILGTLSFLEGSAESATSGQVGGRGVHPFRTMGRMAAAGILLFPVKGGMSIIQLAVIWLAASGTGLADYAWSKTADAIVSAGDYTVAPQQGSTTPDRETLLKFATVLRALTAMQVCAQDLNDIAGALALQAPSLVFDPVAGSDNGWSTKMWMFRDTSIPRPPPGMSGPDVDKANRANYNNSVALCGQVKLFVNSNLLTNPSDVGEQAFSTTAWTMAEKIDALAVNATLRAGTDAVDGTLLTAAQRIADIITGQTQGTDSDISQIAAIAPRTAAKQFLGQLGNGVSGAMSEFELGRGLQEAARSDGWMFAANWQRMGANVARAIAGLRSAVGVEVPRMPTSAREYFGASRIDNNSILEGLIRKSDDHQARLATLKDVWTPPEEKSAAGAGPASSNLTQPGEQKQALADAWASLTNTMSGNRASDPMLQYESLGRAMFGVLSALASAELLTSLGANLPFVGGAVDTVDGFLERMIEIVGIAGIALTVVLPVIPILYYVGAIIGWLALVVECMFSMPVLLISFFSPARGGTWIDSALPGAKTLFGLLLRPFLIIAGLVVMMAAVRIVAPFVDKVFASIFVFANPNGGFFGIVFFGVLSVFYCIACFSVVLVACRFISGLGDSVMGLIGGYVSSLARDHLSDHVVTPINPAGALGRGATALPINPGRMGRGVGGDGRAAIGKLLRGRGVGSGSAP